MKPPPEIDGARVLWWAWSGETPFGAMGQEQVHGFAVCQDQSDPIYRFSCYIEWQCVNDTDHVTVEDAKADIPPNYDVGQVTWQRHTD